jgi:hypothetical protein
LICLVYDDVGDEAEGGGGGRGSEVGGDEPAEPAAREADIVEEPDTERKWEYAAFKNDIGWT